MKINRPGIVLFFISCLISLLFLELGLRITGKILQKSRTNIFNSKIVLGELPTDYDGERDYELFQQNKNGIPKSLWAIGDSYTNAGNVDSNESYPASLFKLIQEENYNYSVINLGQCEDPTWGVYERLKNILDKKKFKDVFPSVVIILVGSSDSFYYLFSKDNSLIRKKQSLVKFSLNKNPWYSELRVFKLLRHVRINLLNRQLSEGGRDISDSQINALHILYKEIYTKYKDNQLQKDDWDKYEQQIGLLLTNHRAFVDGGNRNEFKLDDKIRFVFNTLVVPMMRYYSGKLKYEKALEIMMKFAKDYPDFFWDDKRSHLIALHIMSDTLKFQSRYTALDMKNLLLESSKTVPHLREGKLYKLAEKLFKHNEYNEEQVHLVRTSTWDKIIKLSKKYNFKIVIQNYAPNFTTANDFVTHIAKKYNLPIVDNHKIFKALVKKYKRSILFADDNHFLPKGYELMAENVLEVLKKEKLIKK